MCGWWTLHVYFIALLGCTIMLTLVKGLDMRTQLPLHLTMYKAGRDVTLFAEITTITCAFCRSCCTAEARGCHACWQQQVPKSTFPANQTCSAHQCFPPLNWNLILEGRCKLAKRWTPLGMRAWMSVVSCGLGVMDSF